MEAVWVALIVACAGVLGPLLLARQQNRRLDAIAAQTQKAMDQLGTIEILADGSLTAAYRAELEAVTAQQLLLQDNAELGAAAGRRPTREGRARLAALDSRIVVLTEALADRVAAVNAAQTKIDPANHKGE